MSDIGFPIARISALDLGFKDQLNAYLKREMLVSDEIFQQVREIIQNVKINGNRAVVDYTNKFDNFSVDSLEDLFVSQKQLEKSFNRISVAQRDALEHAANRIEKYHERQLMTSWQYEEEDGSVYGQKITPLNRVGVYVPGNLPSTLLMNAIPAKLAKVKKLVLFSVITIFLFFFLYLRIKLKLEIVSSVFPDLEIIKLIDFLLGSSLI